MPYWHKAPSKNELFCLWGRQIQSVRESESGISAFRVDITQDAIWYSMTWCGIPCDVSAHRKRDKFDRRWCDEGGITNEPLGAFSSSSPPAAVPFLLVPDLGREDRGDEAVRPPREQEHQSRGSGSAAQAEDINGAKRQGEMEVL